MSFQNEVRRIIFIPCSLLLFYFYWANMVLCFDKIAVTTSVTETFLLPIKQLLKLFSSLLRVKIGLVLLVLTRKSLLPQSNTITPTE
jgi:hypothetical protein